MTRREWLAKNPPPRNPAAKCPTHQQELSRHNNRAEDLFVCSVGPHYLLWTSTPKGAGLAPLDMTKPLPELDKEMD